MRRLPRRRRSSEPTGRRRGLPNPKGVSSRTRGLVCGLTSISLLGCQTGRSWDQECRGVYSGVRYYWGQVGEVLVDGKLWWCNPIPGPPPGKGWPAG